MKLLRHGPAGAEKPGILDAEGGVRDLSALVGDLTPDWLSPDRLAALRAIDTARLPLVAPGERLGVPVAGTRQFIAIGLNYRRHAQEAGVEVPQEPVVFMKGLGALGGPDDDIHLAPGSTSTDWEVELAVVIGQTTRRVETGQALAHVAGYCLANDVSDRDWQLHKSGQWGKGKSFDGFGPVGPWLVTADEIADPQDIPLTLRVNGQLRQQSSTGDQIFSVAHVVAYLSQFMTLFPGDIIITGTPEGVGLGMRPPRFLQHGDVMELDGGPLGRQRQRVQAR